MAVRRLYEPLCIAFGTTVSSPTVPTYQLYDLPHKFTPRLYMESEDQAAEAEALLPPRQISVEVDAGPAAAAICAPDGPLDLPQSAAPPL